MVVVPGEMEVIYLQMIMITMERFNLLQLIFCGLLSTEVRTSQTRDQYGEMRSQG